MKVRRSVDRRVMIRRLQGAMDISVVMEQLSHATQGRFDRSVAGTGRGNGNGADCRGELVVDPVVQLMQQHSFMW
jgi:hypothetical protein